MSLGKLLQVFSVSRLSGPLDPDTNLLKPLSVLRAALCNISSCYAIISIEMSSDETLNAGQIVSHVSYWLGLADYDLETGKTLLVGQRLLYVVFMCHQVIEKALKAAFTTRCRTIAPRIHSLVVLAQKSGIYSEMTPAQQDMLEMLEPMNVQCRYPSETDKLLAALTVAGCETMLCQTEELFQWIKSKLSSM